MFSESRKGGPIKIDMENPWIDGFPIMIFMVVFHIYVSSYTGW